MNRVRRNCGGFTLMEVMVALVIGASVLVLAHGFLVTLGDGAERIAATAVEADRESNSERVLRGLVGRLEVGVNDMFDGQRYSASFTSWCDTPSGWLERCGVILSVDTSTAANTLVAETFVGTERWEIVLVSGFEQGVLRYLSDARRGGSWIHVWGRSISAPLAIGVVLDRDTTIVRIGSRG